MMGLFDNILSNPEKRGKQLLAAITSGNTEKATTLIKKGADLKIQDKDKYTAMHLALSKNYPILAQQLIEAGADVNEKRYGDTALHIAAQKGYTAIAEVLIKKGVNLNELNSFNKTALILASANGQIEIVRLLTENRGDINKMASWDTVEYFEERDYEPPPDLDIPGTYNVYVGFSGWDRTVTRSRVIGKNYSTALTEAVKNRYTDIARYLIEKGADVNAQTDHGRTALHFAAGNNDLELVRLLIQKGAEVNVKDKKGRTALHFATETGNTELVKSLIEQGADF